MAGIVDRIFSKGISPKDNDIADGASGWSLRGIIEHMDATDQIGEAVIVEITGAEELCNRANLRIADADAGGGSGKPPFGSVVEQ